jgi:Mce-associated membrane protein
MGIFRKTVTGRALPWVMFVLALAVAVAFAVLWQSSGTDDTEKVALEKEARSFVLALTNFSSDTIDQDLEEIRSFATGDFEGQVNELFSEDTVAAIKDAKATSTATVEALFVQSMTEDEATVFAVLSEEISNQTIDQPRTDVVRMEVGLVKAGDGWKVDSVELFQSPGAGVAPG